jgi:hypothetical protein
MGRERKRDLRITRTVDGLTENRNLGNAAVDDVGHAYAVGPGIDYAISVLGYHCLG